MREGAIQSSQEQQVALLLSDEYSRRDDLLSPLDYDDMADPLAGPSIAGSLRFWAYVRVSEISAGAWSDDEQWAKIEDAYEELNLAPEISGLVRWVPSRPGEEVGLEAMKLRLIDYLQAGSEFFARRDREMLSESPSQDSGKNS